MQKEIREDLFRYEGLTGFKGFIKGLFIPGFRYMYLLRKASKFKKNSIFRIFISLIKLRYEYKYGFQIPSSTQIGGGFYIGHFGTIAINDQAKIGRNCNIAHSVTIGQANRGKLKGFPTLGDNVWIGTGAVIVGNIRIGSNVLIAPLSFVNFDIPDNSIVIGNPAKIIERKNATEGYIEFVLDDSSSK